MGKLGFAGTRHAVEMKCALVVLEESAEVQLQMQRVAQSPDQSALSGAVFDRSFFRTAVSPTSSDDTP